MHRASRPDYTLTNTPILNPCAAAITNKNWIRRARCACDVGDDDAPVCIAVAADAEPDGFVGST